MEKYEKPKMDVILRDDVFAGVGSCPTETPELCIFGD